MDKKLTRISEPGIRLHLLVLLAFAAATFFVGPRWLSYAELGAAAVLLVYFLLSRSRRRKKLLKYLESSLLNADTLSSRSMLTIPLPMAVIRMESGEVIWCNERFKSIAGDRAHLFDVRISEIIPGFETQWVVDGATECPYDIHIDGRTYGVTGSLFKSEQDDGSGIMVVLYWLDKTDNIELRRHLDEKNVICAEVVFDNYDEVMNNISDSKKSTIIAELDRKLSDWTRPSGGVMRKIDRDRYFFVFEEGYFRKYIDSKFDILDQVKEIDSGVEAQTTISIGIGREGETLRENMKNARLALDMALSRGGDQAVVRSKMTFDFYGGRSTEYEKRTKVKARIMANVLNGLIRDCKSVFIMGHRISDNDSLGAAVGMVCAVRKRGKKARIILDRNHTNAGAMLELISRQPEYDGVIISADDAMVEAGADSLMIVVDTNRPNYVESAALLESFNRIAVIDHHRRAADYIANAAVNVHEPSASSTCEIVVELLQYMVEPADILKTEAVCMLAGIALDTKSFTLKTGVRTFDAASFLRRIGADTVEVKHLFQNDFNNYVKRGDLIKSTIFYENRFAIIKSQEQVDLTVAAQAADELLGVAGVRGSFVIYPVGDVIYISARSLGEVNVQLILEKLGGGGHLTTAGCQMRGTTVDKAYQRLIEAIDEYRAQATRPSGQ